MSLVPLSESEKKLIAEACDELVYCITGAMEDADEETAKNDAIAIGILKGIIQKCGGKP